MAAQLDWPTKRLGDLAEFRNGVNYNKTSFGEGVKVVGVADFQDYTKPRYAELDQINPEGIVTERNILRDGDIVFVRSNGNRELIGRSLFIEQPPEEITHSAFTIRLRFTAREVHPKFYAYCFRTRLIRQALTAQGGGTNINNLNQDILSALEVPHPPLPIQRRIAGILSAYDELIENSQRRIKVLESMARAIYREWFVHFRFPGHESISRVSSPIGDIPQGWEAKKLGDLCELRKDPYKDVDHAGLPLLDMARMPSRSLAPGDTGTPAELTTSRILFQRGDTLFGAIRCYLHKVVAAHYPGVTNTSVLVLRPRSPSFRSLVAIVASDIDTIRWAETQSTGTKMPVINWGVFQSMPSPIPSKALAQAFEDIAGPILDEIGILATQIQTLRRTRDLLLPRLLTGQIELDELEAA
ncbi:restriction endonuclease subunit S [Accumulibacter sp.]|uniref:restriction endonuclease subunit S n=1 Tax=Accumulibacter sp. TaxID=2053492 RepID=UPI0025E0BC23|nr:restriction endonuclease subunit S [Accumulibacter sp.]MCM8595929.1 restriction endonuclease subunit S [Accumulibacter sp.]MCM8624780.1 restriction endonuclease subunit S [Accumulibacter sp.]MDS4050078.1 restriction endonuclease subunit S [Accumulibacter sp.]